MADDQTPDENTEPAPTEPANPAPVVPEPVAAEPVAAAPAPSSARGWIWGAAAIVVVLGLVAGAYFVGRSSVHEGPTSLADAARQSAEGDLPVGDLSLNDITGALGKDDFSILGGKSGGASGVLDDLLNNLGKELQKQLKDGLKNGSGNDSSSGSRTPAASAFLGVSTTPAPSGQTGVQVTAVKAGGPAADAGLQRGDVVTAVDGKAVGNAAALVTQIQTHSPGDVVTITYTRNGTSAEARVRLGNTTASATPPTTTTPTI